MCIRPGQPSDVPTIAQVYVDSWKSTYEGLVPDFFLKGMTFEVALKIFMESFEDKTHTYQTLVVETLEGKMVGFADFGRERSHPKSGAGELYGIYILKEFQRQGIGLKLFTAAQKGLAVQGISSMIVWVLEKSPYQAFYAKTGGVLQTGVKKLGPVGQQIQLASYLWDPLQ